MKKALLYLFLLVFSSSLFAQTYEELTLKSIEYIDKEDYAAAEQVLKQAMRKEPGNPGNMLLLSNLGTVQRQLGQLDDALISYSAALVKQPDNTFILHNRAALYCELDQLDNAIKDYNTILALSPEDTEALYRRGLIHLDRKNLLAAEEDFEQIALIDPNAMLAPMGLALVYKKQGDWEKAEKLYTSLLIKNRTQADLFLNRGECYLNMKKLGRAQEDFNKAQELGYVDSYLYILRGQLSLQQFDKFSAKNNFQKAKELGANAEVIDHFLKLCK